MELYFVTGNANKFKEVQEIFKPLALKRLDQEVDEIQSMELKKVGEAKAKSAYALIKKPVFVEDVSLEIKALNNFPGPFIKWIHQTIDNKGLLKLMQNEENRDAVAKAIVCLYDGKKMKSFLGEIKGTIAYEEKGTEGWGFDPIFIPNGQEKTIAELGYDWKNKHSHRYKTHIALKNYIKG